MGESKDKKWVGFAHTDCNESVLVSEIIKYSSGPTNCFINISMGRKLKDLIKNTRGTLKKDGRAGGWRKTKRLNFLNNTLFFCYFFLRSLNNLLQLYYRMLTKFKKYTRRIINGVERVRRGRSKSSTSKKNKTLK